MTASSRPRERLGSGARIAILLAATVLGGGLVGGVYGWLDHTDAMPGPLTAALILFVLFGLMIAGTIWWWLHADEAVREAHKWAWYWGGSIGMCVGLGALLLASAYGGDQPVPATLSFGEVLLAGAMLVLAPMLIGYGVAWFAWWLAKRR